MTPDGVTWSGLRGRWRPALELRVLASAFAARDGDIADLVQPGVGFGIAVEPEAQSSRIGEGFGHRIGFPA